MSARRWASVAVVAVVALGGLTSVGLANQPGRSAASARIAKAHPSVTFPIRAERCRFTLTLQRIDPHVLFFTDRPVHESGVIPTADMIQGLFAHGIAAPNASVAT
jgi:hypothetical protein